MYEKVVKSDKVINCICQTKRRTSYGQNTKSGLSRLLSVSELSELSELSVISETVRVPVSGSGSKMYRNVPVRMYWFSRYIFTKMYRSSKLLPERMALEDTNSTWITKDQQT